jgi:hypothetical protein
MTKHPDRLEVVAQAQVGTLWSLSFGASLSKILAPGFFQRFSGYQLRLADRINVTAHYGEPEMQFAQLVVTHVGGKQGSDLAVQQIAGGAL